MVCLNLLFQNTINYLICKENLWFIFEPQHNNCTNQYGLRTDYRDLLRNNPLLIGRFIDAAKGLWYIAIFAGPDHRPIPRTTPVKTNDFNLLAGLTFYFSNITAREFQ
jgi:hypothetical protein